MMLVDWGLQHPFPVFHGSIVPSDFVMLRLPQPIIDTRMLMLDHLTLVELRGWRERINERIYDEERSCDQCRGGRKG